MSLSTASVHLTSSPTAIELNRLKQSTSICTNVQATSDQQMPRVTWNLADDDINGLESTTNHASIINEQRSKSSTKTNSQTKQRQKQQPPRRKRPQHTESTKLRQEPLGVRRSRFNQAQIKKIDNHLPTKGHIENK
ncbi:unnamed protein product [Rotaria magnacalcarata]|nr:unnamed protein product [Rotaria magnacalcarata]CAF5202533.1 unnamed protein product [Rotaria magnacalcarata]